MKLHLTQIAITLTMLDLSIAASAQQVDSKAATSAPATSTETVSKGGKSVADIIKVEIKGASDYDPRRDDTASKTVLTQEEILKYGDTNVYDVLKRAPGVTVIGNSIRMRGLGNGYTQILVNGERPPPGFSIDALTLDQIERIEIIRAATAEFSMQGIAGTLNIVLKKVVSKPQRDMRLNVMHTGEADSQSLLGTLADRTGDLSYYLNGNISRNANGFLSISTDQFTAPNGQVLQLRGKSRLGQNKGASLGLSPRLNYKLANGDQLNWSAYVQASRNDNVSDSGTTNLVGTFPAPDYVYRHSDGANRSHFLGSELNWVAKLAGGKLDAKVSASTGKLDNQTVAFSSTVDRLANFLRQTDSTSHISGYSSVGKYSRSMFEGHALASGWDASYQRTEDDLQRLEGSTGVTPTRVVEQFRPEMTRLAVFVQDEWNVTKLWSIYQGVRWETIRTESVGTDLQTTQSRSHVLSPVAQTLYKFPDKRGRQLRLALTRTYKAPYTFQLSARRFIADLNTRFTPDSSGNPDLQPELATGVDLTYEHFWAPGAVFSVGTSARHITNYIRTELIKDRNGYWLIQPVNEGSAQVQTLDVELKFPLKTVWKSAPAFDLRASVNRNWSKVASVPGPDNRLDQQVPLSAVFGIDYKEGKYSAGANYGFRAGGLVRMSEQQSVRSQPSRDLDAYVLYKMTAALQLRLSVNNALARQILTESIYQDTDGISQSWSRNPNSRKWQGNLEMKF